MTKVIIGILLFVNTAEAAERIKRIAILDFRNASPDNGNAWVSGWISDVTCTDLNLAQHGNTRAYSYSAPLFSAYTL